MYYPSEQCAREAARCERSAAKTLNAELSKAFKALAHVWRELAAAAHRSHPRDHLMVRLMDVGARLERAAHT